MPQFEVKRIRDGEVKEKFILPAIPAPSRMHGVPCAGRYVMPSSADIGPKIQRQLRRAFRRTTPAVSPTDIRWEMFSVHGGSLGYIVATLL